MSKEKIALGNLLQHLNINLELMQIGLRELVKATQKHTEYCREADELDRQEQMQDKSDTQTWTHEAAPFSTHPTADEIRGMHRSINAQRRAAALPEFVEPGPTMIPTELVELMQVTPHQFVRNVWRPRTERLSNNYNKCRVCQLPSRNAVHLVLLPTFNHRETIDED